MSQVLFPIQTTSQSCYAGKLMMEVLCPVYVNSTRQTRPRNRFHRNDNFLFRLAIIRKFCKSDRDLPPPPSYTSVHKGGVCLGVCLSCLQMLSGYSRCKKCFSPFCLYNRSCIYLSRTSFYSTCHLELLEET